MQVGDRADRVVVSRFGFYNYFIQYSEVLVSTNISKNVRVKSLDWVRVADFQCVVSCIVCE